MFDTEDTIAAIASARAGAVRGIVRIAGPKTVDLVCAMSIDPPLVSSPGTLARTPRAYATSLAAGATLGNVACDVYLWPGHRSYTRQPAAEIHTLGSPPVLDALLAAICRAGARMARPGEFTLRAFLAGRLDLTQAEAVLGVIDATSPMELDVALGQLAGGLARPLQELRDQLVELVAQLEAGLDFAEEDIEFLTSAELGRQLVTAVRCVQRLLHQIRVRGELPGEPRVVLRGLPNVGKSSLFNALVGSDCSLVSPIAATTRDYLQAVIQIEGRAIQLVDTAGVEACSVGIGNAAQRMSEAQSRQAAIELFCLDATRPLDAWEWQRLSDSSSASRIVVFTKCDAPARSDWTGPAVATSSRTSRGLPTLRQEISARLNCVQHAESAVVDSTAVRCTGTLENVVNSLERAQQLQLAAAGDELVAAELRFALDELGVVVGTVYTDDILDRLFSRFCIGK